MPSHREWVVTSDRLRRTEGAPREGRFDLALKLIDDANLDREDALIAELKGHLLTIDPAVARSRCPDG
jgi:hypothetical protein